MNLQLNQSYERLNSLKKIHIAGQRPSLSIRNFLRRRDKNRTTRMGPTRDGKKQTFL